MRFVWAIVALFLAVVCVGAGVAQRTVFLGPNTQTEKLEVDETQKYTLIDASVLSYLPGGQTFMARGEGEVYGAYARTTDMTAWLADTTYNHVTVEVDAEGKKKIVSEVVPVTYEPTVETETEGEETATPAPEETEAAADETAEGEEIQTDAGRNPAGSDLWVAEYTDQDSLIQQWSLPADMSVLVAADGTAPAPSDISVKWSIDNSTPWVGPLIVLGGIFTLIGLVLWILGIRHIRKKRGPRRRGLPPLPETQPLSLKELKEAEEKGVITTTPAEKTRTRRAFIVLPVMLASAVALSGCTAESWPQVEASTPTPTPTPTVITPEDQKPPVLLESQATRILAQISESAAAADEAMDPAAAGERLGGPVLDARETNYTLRGAIAEYASPTAVPENWKVLLPQASDTWPRSFLAIYWDETQTAVPPAIMMVTQQDQWSDYKLEYSAEMEAGIELPKLAPTTIGATAVNPDNTFLQVAPAELGTMYADLIANGDQSEYADIYDLAGDTFREQLVAKRQEVLTTFQQSSTGTGEMTFSTETTDEYTPALATLDSGAIVAVTINDVYSPRSTNTEASIKLGDDPIVSTLTGVSESKVGFKTTYQAQLFFYVPAQGSTEQIRLLGYSSSILGAEELK